MSFGGGVVELAAADVTAATLLPCSKSAVRNQIPVDELGGPLVHLADVATLAGAGVAVGDTVLISDTDAAAAKRMTFPQFIKGLIATIDSGDKPVFPSFGISTASVCVGNTTVGLTSADGQFIGIRDNNGLSAASLYGVFNAIARLGITTGNPYFSAVAARFVAISAGRALMTDDTETLNGYLRQSGKMTSTDVTLTDATLTNLTALSVTVFGAQKVRLRAVLYVTGALAADGVKFDFNGGTAVITAARFQGYVQDTGGITPFAATTDINTDITQATVTGASKIVIDGALIVGDGGTFVIRLAKNADAGGDLVLHPGSNVTFEDMG